MSRFRTTTAVRLRWRVILHTAGRLDPSQAARPLAWHLIECMHPMLADAHRLDGRQLLRHGVDPDGHCLIDGQSYVKAVATTCPGAHHIRTGLHPAHVARRPKLSNAATCPLRDHAAYVQGLSRQRTLLERRIYVVVPWSSELGVGIVASPAPRMRLFGRRGRGNGRGDDLSFREEIISRQLTDRCHVIGRQLGRAGLWTTRLDDLGLAQLYHVSWAPEIARTQRSRRELADYTALVVGASP